MSVSLQNRIICKYNLRGQCRFGKRCRNIHEEPENIMDYVERNFLVLQSTPPHIVNTTNTPQPEGACALSPSKNKQNENNENTVSSSNEPSTSAVQESFSNLSISEPEEKTCGICFDIVLKKSDPNEQSFGILPNCNHCFCFACITKWRQTKEFDFTVSKACPECRVASEFVYRTKVWLEQKETKEAYIDRQKQKMKLTDCRYFRKGKSQCPFGNKCLFLHALPNGQEIDIGPPKRRRCTRLSTDDLLHQIVYWLNDEELDLDTDDEDDGSWDLDLDDPYISVQYYEDDFRRYMAWERLIRGNIHDNSDTDIFY